MQRGQLSSGDMFSTPWVQVPCTSCPPIRLSYPLSVNQTPLQGSAARFENYRNRSRSSGRPGLQASHPQGHGQVSFSVELDTIYILLRPCYIMACYCTVGEQNKPLQPERQESVISNASLGSMSSFSWKKGSMKNLASISGSETSKRSKHFMTNPGGKQFRTEDDCSVHHECNDPIYRLLASLQSL